MRADAVRGGLVRARQAMPGPLFNFAAYLGAIAGGIPGIPLCWLGLFGPGIMLIFGVLPLWGWCVLSLAAVSGASVRTAGKVPWGAC